VAVRNAIWELAMQFAVTVSYAALRAKNLGVIEPAIMRALVCTCPSWS
jgi:hypothetical protein